MSSDFVKVVTVAELKELAEPSTQAMREIRQYRALVESLTRRNERLARQLKKAERGRMEARKSRELWRNRCLAAEWECGVRR